MPDSAKKPILNSHRDCQDLSRGPRCNAIHGFEGSMKCCARKCRPGEDSSLILSAINRQSLDPSDSDGSVSSEPSRPAHAKNVEHGIVYIYIYIDLPMRIGW